jgi:16S rRNA (adenine1518-N6/adenine1519-N6)-dimethyltransferase
MQTKSDIEQLLTQAGTVPKKRFGQHFLIDLNLMRMMVEAALVSADDVVLEVGCGTGSLTAALAECAGFVVGVELDQELAPIAAAQVAHKANVHLVVGDALEGKHYLHAKVRYAIEQARRVYPGRLLLVSNLPYGAASPLLVNLAVGPITADAMVATVQREVADRILAQPGTKEYGILTILLQAFGSVELLRVLKPSVFWPPPQVDSAMIHFARDPAKVSRIVDVPLTVQTVDLFMGHRRKMLKAVARSAQGRLARVTDWPVLFHSCGIEPTWRPERVSPDQFVALANAAAAALRAAGQGS